MRCDEFAFEIRKTKETRQRSSSLDWMSVISTVTEMIVLGERKGNMYMFGGDGEKTHTNNTWTLNAERVKMPNAHTHEYHALEKQKKKMFWLICWAIS